jgi:glutamine phosphoribosylpyrophosphate amidotransferase
MLAAVAPQGERAARIGADAVVYQSLEDLQELYSDLPCCYACFSGKYPIDGSEALLAEIERERECSKKD